VIGGILYGMKPAVTAIVLFAAYRIGTRVLRNGVLWTIALAAFGAIFALQVPFPYIVLVAAAIGIVGGRVSPERFSTAGTHGVGRSPAGPALIDDDSPVPAWARYTRQRMLASLAAGVLTWCVAEAALYLAFGWHGPLTQMGWFFTKAALVTFGGAYAVLPYVYQGGVEHYGWLTAEQMIDGLALGETTPGPLIIVVVFVGFVGGWTQEVFGASQLVAGGVAGALVAAVFTFLPSFLFILLGGPAVEATRHDIKFAAPLTAITAAVVGVILNLAVFFAWHVLWPAATGAQVFAGPFDWFALLIATAAFVALWRFNAGILPVIGAAALAGALFTMLAS
jgi:chromate transporter